MTSNLRRDDDVLRDCAETKDMETHALKLGICCARLFFERKHSPGRRHLFEACQHHPGFDVVLTGPGWPNYREDLPLRHNIYRLMPHCEALWVYKMAGNPRLNVPAVINWRKTGIFTFSRFHEFFWCDYGMFDQACDETEGLDLVLAAHSNDVPRFEKMRVPVIHLQHCSNPDIFCRPAAQKSIDCLISGSVSSEHYPFRTRLRDLMRSGRIQGKELAHPGYFLEPEQNVRQLKTYAEHLATSRISLCCTSKWKYALNKLQPETWMCGSVVAGDLPDCPEYVQAYGDVHLELRTDWDDERIVQTIQEALSRPRDLQERAATGLQIAISRYTTDHFAERLLEILSDRISKKS